jgi:class 3 adenylate cyclase
MALIEFSGQQAADHKAIVVSFDLAGFSVFCNQPDASTAAPRLMAHTFKLLNGFFKSGGLFSFSEAELAAPDFCKFSGDGALMIWLLPSEHKDFPQDFCNLLVKTMRDFQITLSENLKTWEKQWRLHKLPKKVRVGIATGVVYEMKPPRSVFEPDAIDYVGYCINLAVRLQDYCPELGFLVHGVLMPELQGMGIVEATNMKGTQIEPVALFEEDIKAAPPKEFQSKFRTREA